MDLANAPRNLFLISHYLDAEHHQEFEPVQLSDTSWALESHHAGGTWVLTADRVLGWYPGATWRGSESEPESKTQIDAVTPGEVADAVHVIITAPLDQRADVAAVSGTGHAFSVDGSGFCENHYRHCPQPQPETLPGGGIMTMPRHDDKGAVTREWLLGHGDPEHAREIRLTRDKNYPQVSRPGPAWQWQYSYTADGGPNRTYGFGLATARRRLRKNFPNATIVETWKN
jgi:hypothetical protein